MSVSHGQGSRVVIDNLARCTVACEAGPHPGGRIRFHTVEPETRYALLDGQRIAYQMLGAGPIDVVLLAGRTMSMEAEWDDPEAALFYQRVSSFCRLIRYDLRGTGASDPVPLDALPPLESSVDELMAVMDTAGSERAVILGALDGGPVALLAAVTRPERVMGLVIYNSPARFLNAADYPIGLPPEVAGMMESADPAVWKEFIAVANPSRASDQSYLRRMQRLMRSVAGPSAVSAYGSEMVNRDVRSLLPAVHVPTLILHRANNLVFPPELAQYLADRIEGAKLVMIEGSDMSPFYERPEVFIEKVREFLHEVGPTDGPLTAPDRVMATILFTDITASTELAQERGDSEWMHLLEMHDSMSRRWVEAQLGRVIKTTGDGIMARFDSPGRGIVSAIALRSELGRIALPIRAGLHTGEVELREDDLGGVAVHIAARVLAAAGPGEILVSQTIKDLVVGSDFRFADRGRHHLKGIEGDWQLFALAD